MAALAHGRGHGGERGVGGRSRSLAGGWGERAQRASGQRSNPRHHATQAGMSLASPAAGRDGRGQYLPTLRVATWSYAVQLAPSRVDGTCQLPPSGRCDVRRCAVYTRQNSPPVIRIITRSSSPGKRNTTSPRSSCPDGTVLCACTSAASTAAPYVELVRPRLRAGTASSAVSVPGPEPPRRTTPTASPRIEASAPIATLRTIEHPDPRTASSVGPGPGGPSRYRRITPST